VSRPTTLAEPFPGKEEAEEEEEEGGEELVQSVHDRIGRTT